MSKYRKRPVFVDAFRLPALDDHNMEPFHAWCKEVGFHEFWRQRDGDLSIKTLEGVTIASPGDWIIKGTKGEFYPCKDEIFQGIYEPV